MQTASIALAALIASLGTFEIASPRAAAQSAGAAPVPADAAEATASEEGTIPVPAAYASPAPAASEETSGTRKPDTSAPQAPARVGAEIGMGFTAGLVVGMVGGAVGAGIDAASCGEDFFSGCALAGGVIGRYGVALASIPLAVTWAFTSSILLPLVGAIVGYELDDDSARASGPDEARGPTVAPTIALDGERAVFGLGGTF
jgi:hypothetical protein